MLTKPKLLVKAVNTWVRSAFGNVFHYISTFSCFAILHSKKRRFHPWLKVLSAFHKIQIPLCPRSTLPGMIFYLQRSETYFPLSHSHEEALLTNVVPSYCGKFFITPNDKILLKFCSKALHFYLLMTF